MADNRYRKYLNGEESSRPSFLGGLAHTAITTAGIAVGGIGAYKGLQYLSKTGLLEMGVGALGRRASKLDSYMTGLNETFKTAGVFKTLLGGATEELEANLTESFKTHAVGELRRIAGRGSLNGELTRAEKSYMGRGKALGEIGETAVNSVRLKNVLSELANEQWAQNKPELLQEAERILVHDKYIMRRGFERGSKENSFAAQVQRGVEDALRRAEVAKRFPDEIAITSGGFASSIQEAIVKQGTRREFTSKFAQDGTINANWAAIAEQTHVLKAAHDKAQLEFNKRVTAGSMIANKILPQYELLTVGKASQMGLFDYTNAFLKTAKDGNISTHTIKPQSLQSLRGFEDAFVDPLVFIHKTRGTVLDMRFGKSAISKSMNTLSNGFQIPLLNIKPFRLMTVLNREAVEKTPNYIFRRQDVSSALGFMGKNLPEDNYYYMGGRIFNSGGQFIDGEFRLASSKFGLFQREGAAMAGYSKFNGKESIGFVDRMRDFFGIGKQEYPSEVSRKISGLTKFWNVDWDRNLWYNITDKTRASSVSKDILSTAYGRFVNTVDNATTGLSRNTIMAMKDQIISSSGQEVYDAMMSGTRKEGTIQAIYKMLQRDDLRSETRREFTDIVSQYIKDPEGFDRPIRTVKRGYQADLPNVLDSFRFNKTDVISSIDQAEKLLHMELLNQTQNLSKNITVGSIVQDMFKKGAIGGKQADEMLDLYTLNEMRNLGKMGHLTEPEEFAGLLQQPGESQKIIHEHLDKMIRDANPNFGEGPGERPESFFPGLDYIPIRKTNAGLNARNLVTTINESLQNGGSISDIGATIGNAVLDGVGSLGFGTAARRAGRSNLDKASSLSFGSYHYLYRLNEGLSTIGLGLPTKDLGSTQDIAKNLFLKRIMAPLLAINALGYVNYQVGSIFGEKPNQSFAKAYAGMTLDVQKFKDLTGLNQFGREIERTLPGFNLLYENPLGLALKYGSFGLLGENRGAEEMKRYYEKGYDTMRKGRFWGIGSNTPMYGGRVEYFAPSWYRQTMGEPEMTSSLYGSEGEYWANSWFPTPSNLFGLKPLLDPYHWESKHRKDRPYPVTGGTELRQVPIIGPLLDIPASAIFKPTRKYPGLEKAHREYLSEINEAYKQFNAEANSGAYLMIYPGGRITPVSYTGEGVTYGEGIGSGTGIAGGIPGGASVAGEDGSIAVVDPTVGFSSGRTGRSMARNQLTTINQNWVQASNIKPIDGRSIQLLRDHTYVDSLEQAMDPNSLQYRLGESAYSLTEIGGMYGFLFNTFTGAEDRLAPRVALQASSRMTGLERAFWDQSLGGLGGDLSEIYRRFLPHKRNQIDEYNPIRNTMPDWMPGLDYFIDFKHGDPYIKVPKGEGRLPGAGYESMNKLHSDPWFGRYGALDRFKILADVAPWSAQYKYYAGVISGLNQEGMIASEDYEDVKRIREMVSQRKEKYDLYPYKFRYAGNIEKKTVTVERMLDDMTFLSSEMPGTPIRLAGIDLPAKDNEQYQEIKAEISKYLSPGKRVRVALESDPLTRASGDTMSTMRAAVYDMWGNPIQGKLARKYDSIKADWKDESATTVNSLYSSSEITLGKVWEAFAHLDTPLHTKLLKVRSPLEHYKRQMLYGKDWQSWSHPFRDWIGPTVDKLAAGSPSISMAVGAGIGALFGTFKRHKAVGAIIGGLVGGIAPSIRTIWQAGGRIAGNSDYTWIPKRRQQERDLDEYFDMLKYVKYKGLYEKARRAAISSEGIDPEAIAKYSETSGGKTAQERRKLEGIKRWLKIYSTGDEDSTKENIKVVNNRLKELSGNKMLVKAGPMTMRALQYRQESEATLYGADPYGDLQVIYRALPKKDRPFFTKFMTATPQEREEILRLVPENQKKFYQAKWGLKPDEQESVGEYFSKHELPDANWEGWKPNQSLEAIKLKFIQNTALDMGEFGFWPDDAYYARNAPAIEGIAKNPLSTLDVTRLRKVLHGAGIRDSDIQIVTEMSDTPDGLFNVNVNMSHDRRQDVKNAMNENMAYLAAEYE